MYSRINQQVLAFPTTSNSECCFQHNHFMFSTVVVVICSKYEGEKNTRKGVELCWIFQKLF